MAPILRRMRTRIAGEKVIYGRGDEQDSATSLYVHACRKCRYVAQHRLPRNSTTQTLCAHAARHTVYARCCSARLFDTEANATVQM